MVACPTTVVVLVVLVVAAAAADTAADTAAAVAAKGAARFAHAIGGKPAGVAGVVHYLGPCLQTHAASLPFPPQARFP